MRQAVRAVVVRDNQILLMHRNKFGREYFTLPGGAIGPGETHQQALARELAEECSLRLVGSRHVFTEHVGTMYGTQYIYLCETEGDAVRLSPDSEEAKINKLGHNIHTPMWYPLKDFADTAFRTPHLQEAILLGISHGFPSKQAVSLDGQFMEQVQSIISSQKKR